MSLLKRAQTENTPLIDGRTATFLWNGPNPPILTGDFNDWDENTPTPWQKTTTHNLWQVSFDFPPDAYLEYALGPQNQRQPDPYNNKRTTPNGLGQRNHFFYMPQATPTSLTLKQTSLPHGTVTPHFIPTNQMIHGRLRRLYLYQPPTTQPTPLILVFDGTDYYRRARLTTIIDNLIAQKRIPPVSLAMLNNGGINGRRAEYACSDATLYVIHNILLPYAQKHLNLLDINTHPGSYATLGASMGGLISLYTALRLPHIFGHVISQSGAFTFAGHDTIVYDLLAHIPANIRISLDCGRFESFLACNRRMHQHLLNNGYDATYREHNSGHNYTAWRNNIHHALLWYQPTP
ncbi:MAG TPA: alpha/beta hydrolase-fold protein [Anaerolineae bacterium]|nr:alpha/beta hydrolase-fold protein [Anaerolineae bacterium]